MTIYESNLSMFKEQGIEAYNALVNDKPIYDVSIESTDDPNNDIIIHDNCRCFVNSIYDTESEMANMTRHITEDTEVAIIFGVANGQIITYLQKHFANIKRIYIIEPSLDMLKRFLSKVDFRGLFKRNGLLISLILNKKQNEIDSSLIEVYLTLKNVVLIEHISYRTAFSSYYNHVNSIILEYLRTYRYNIRTLRSMYLHWANNCIVNIRREILMLDSLFKHIEGKPAVLVSAGPSLKKNMHLLNSLKGKALMFAGGSTIRILADNNIIPDVRASIDALDFQCTLFKDVMDEDVPLLCRNMSNIPLMNRYKGPKIRSIIEDDYIGKYISNIKGIPFTQMASSPTVSNFIFEVLIAAKCNPIIFVGQDMCSYGDSRYADSDQNANVAKMKMKKEMEMLDIYGNTVTTELNYLQVKYSLDRQAKRCTTRLINATEGGLGINGTEIKTLESVINEDLTECIDIDIKEVIKAEQLETSYIENNNKVLEALAEIKTEAEEIIDIFIEIFGAIDNYSRLKANNYKEGKLRSTIEHIEQLHKQLDEKPLYKEVVLKATYTILQAFQYKYSYIGTDKIEILDNKLAKIASNAEVNFKYVKEFLKIQI